MRSPVLGSGLDIPARGSCEPKTTSHDVKVLTDSCLILKHTVQGFRNKASHQISTDVKNVASDRLR